MTLPNSFIANFGKYGKFENIGTNDFGLNSELVKLHQNFLTTFESFTKKENIETDI